MRVAGQGMHHRSGALLVSLLVVGLGLGGAHALKEVDQDLRILYTEFTVAATDLAHISADVMRYRATIIRAIEAPTKDDFLQISNSLPDQRARIEQAVDHYVATMVRVLGERLSETEDLQAVRQSLAAYFSAAVRTMSLLEQLWTADSPQQAAQFRTQAELHAAQNAGTKLIEVSQALDRLMNQVTEVARDLRNQWASTIRLTSLALILGSVMVALLNLFISGVLRVSQSIDEGPAGSQGPPVEVSPRS
jgi:hypothetical protein